MWGTYLVLGSLLRWVFPRSATSHSFGQRVDPTGRGILEDSLRPCVAPAKSQDSTALSIKSYRKFGKTRKIMLPGDNAFCRRHFFLGLGIRFRPGAFRPLRSSEKSLSPALDGLKFLLPGFIPISSIARGWQGAPNVLKYCFAVSRGRYFGKWLPRQAVYPKWT